MYYFLYLLFIDQACSVKMARYSPRSFRNLPHLMARYWPHSSLSAFFTITAEIHARSLVNFYCQYADRHMNLKFMRLVSERERAIALFTVNLAHLHYNEILHVCEAISDYFVVLARNCLASTTSTLDYIVLQMSKINHEKGYSTILLS